MYNGLKIFLCDICFSLFLDIYKGKKFHLHYGVKTLAEFILPPGESEILCAVKDQLGATTTLSVDTIVVTVFEYGYFVNN